MDNDGKWAVKKGELWFSGRMRGRLVWASSPEDAVLYDGEGEARRAASDLGGEAVRS